jgi:hypothetical protein
MDPGALVGAHSYGRGLSRVSSGHEVLAHEKSPREAGTSGGATTRREP